MMRTIAYIAAAAALVGSGLIHGAWTGRWRPSPALGRAADALARVPMDLGDWRGRGLEMDPDEFAQTEAAGYLLRRYENRRTGEEVMLLVICGRPGPVSVHTPDVCYRGAGYDLEGAPARARLAGDDRPDEFFVGRFRKRDAVAPSYLRIAWAWNATGAWEAVDNPRLSFARHPALYKIYVVRQAGEAGRPDGGEDPATAFLKRLLPELDKDLPTGARTPGPAPSPSPSPATS